MATAVNVAERQVYVSEWKNGRVSVFDLDGNFVRVIGRKKKSPGPCQFRHPHGVFFDPVASLLLVADAFNHRIQVIRPAGSGTMVSQIGSFGSEDGQLDLPTSAVMHPVTRRIFVCDSDNHRIQVFNEEGGYEYQFGTQGSEPGQLDGPFYLCIDAAADQVLVTEIGNHRVSVFSTKGEHLGCFGSEGSDDGQFIRPRGIVVHPITGHIIVADQKNHRLQVFARQDAKRRDSTHIVHLRSIGSQGSEPDQLHFPDGLCVHPITGRIYVADFHNHRVVGLPSVSIHIGRGAAWLACMRMLGCLSIIMTRWVKNAIQRNLFST